MAFADTTWYCNAGDQSTTGHYAVAKRPQNTAVVAGVVRRQFTAPAVNSERCFVCIVAGTTANVADATWVLTRGAKTVDGTATWQECTGASAMNGDLTNTPNWTAQKAVSSPTLGSIIKRNNGASYQICTTAGTMAVSEPAFSDTAGVTTNDGTSVWTSLGPVGNFSTGGAPHARLASGMASTWFVAGNTLYVGDNHAESQATIWTPTLNGGTAGLSKVICHNRSGSYPPAASDLATGASISTTGAVNMLITPTAGAYYFNGLTWKSAVGQSSSQSLQINASNSWLYFDACSFEVASTNVAASLQIGTGSQAGNVTFNNTTVKFASVIQAIQLQNGFFHWRNTGTVLASGSSVPTNFINSSGSFNVTAVLEGLDLSQLTGALVNASAAFSAGGVTFVDCKLNASATLSSPSAALGITHQIVRSDSGATAYKSARYSDIGAETTETTITRVGGAVDPTGQAQSRKVVTTAAAQWLRPFKAEPYAVWNSVTGANVIVTVYGTINAGALPFNDDIWLELEYLGSSATPLGTLTTTTKASLLAANAAVASDSSSWNLPAVTLDGVATNATLSNGNLTATHTNSTTNSGARSTAYHVGGDKLYFEAVYTVVTGNGSNIGILTAVGNYNDLCNALSGVELMRQDGNIYSGGSFTSKTLGALLQGDVIAVAVDFTARLAWFRRFRGGSAGNWNGDAAADPATGVGGVTVGTGAFAPAISFGGTGTGATEVTTTNFGASAFAMTQPSGFVNWNTGWSPFKLTKTLSAPQPGLAGYIYARVRAAKLSTTYYIDPQITLS